MGTVESRLLPPDQPPPAAPDGGEPFTLGVSDVNVGH